MIRGHIDKYVRKYVRQNISCGMCHNKHILRSNIDTLGMIGEATDQDMLVPDSSSIHLRLPGYFLLKLNDGLLEISMLLTWVRVHKHWRPQ